MSNLIKINQSLHGYDEGHNLIVASMQFPLNSKRILRIMSDMSGTSMLPNFEEYITGYSIKEINMYAIAKTWYAPEMRREGCVWTHTLLFDFSDLIHINNYKKIIELFKKPSSNLNFDDYNTSIELNNQDIAEAIPLNSDSEIVANIVYNLYTYSSSSLLVSSLDPKKYEDVILSIWAQQWPRLKRNFSFCSGALNPRSIEKQYLDVQIIPSQLKVNDTSAFIYLKEHIDNPINNVEWLNILLNDIISPTYTFRNYLNIYGSDVKENREALVPLVTLSYYLGEKFDPQSIHFIIEFLGNNFPPIKEANNLKIILLDNKKGLFKEEDILYELGTTNYYDSFNYDRLDFDKRFISLYEKDENATFLLLSRVLRGNINPFGETMIQSISSVIKNSSINILINKYRDLLSIFIISNPQIAYCPDFWATNSTLQLENFNLLKKVDSKLIDWQDIIFNMLNSEVCIDKEVVKEVVPDLIYHILNWHNNNKRPVLSTDWILILKDDRKEVLNWLKVETQICGSTLELIISILNPNSRIVLERGLNMWLKILENSDLNVKNKIQVKSFFFAIAMNFSNYASILILSYVFDDVYKAALNDNLDYYSWQILEVHTKPLSFFQDWDKCKKIRRAIVNKFIENNWSIDYLSALTKDKDLRKDLFTLYIKKS